jgi:alkaline phosphatase D
MLAIGQRDRPPGSVAKSLGNLCALQGHLSISQQALAERNPEVAPHLSFVDVGGHGFSVVRASAGELEVEFVCIPRPLERHEDAPGPPLAYRMAHRVKRWPPGRGPRLQRSVREGSPPCVW